MLVEFPKIDTDLLPVNIIIRLFGLFDLLGLFGIFLGFPGLSEESAIGFFQKQSLFTKQLLTMAGKHPKSRLIGLELSTEKKAN